MRTDPLKIVDRYQQPTHSLRDMLGARSAFLVGGGPSARQLPLDELSCRGCWSMAINNMAGHCRTNAFVCSDDPRKFSHCIWLDPSVMKFVPTTKFGRTKSRLRRKLPDGTFESLPQKVLACPNVWGWQRRDWLQPDDTFFSEPEVSIGNFKKGARRTGQPKTLCTLLAGIRLLAYLGAARIFLVGVDFHMDEARGVLDNYAFAEQRDKSACVSNNDQYTVTNRWLCEMAASGVFDRRGVEIYNTNPHSGLRAFPFVPFERAVTLSTRDVEQIPDLEGWYVKRS